MKIHLHEPPTDPAEDFVLFGIAIATIIVAIILFSTAVGVN